MELPVTEMLEMGNEEQEFNFGLVTHEGSIK